MGYVKSDVRSPSVDFLWGVPGGLRLVILAASVYVVRAITQTLVPTSNRHVKSSVSPARPINKLLALGLLLMFT
jgi:hypothetical protein